MECETIVDRKGAFFLNNNIPPQAYSVAGSCFIPSPKAICKDITLELDSKGKASISITSNR
jgi:hypothetical protein